MKHKDSIQARPDCELIAIVAPADDNCWLEMKFIANVGNGDVGERVEILRPGFG